MHNKRKAHLVSHLGIRLKNLAKWQRIKNFLPTIFFVSISVFLLPKIIAKPMIASQEPGVRGVNNANIPQRISMAAKVSINIFDQIVLDRAIIPTMGTASPTTRSALPVYKFQARPFDPVVPRLVFFSRHNPADPLIACKWCNIFPCYLSRWDRSKGFS